MSLGVGLLTLSVREAALEDAGEVPGEAPRRAA